MLSKSGEDFFLCFSPERIDPGNPKFQTANIPKVVGGVTKACTEMGQLFYSQALQHVVPVSSTQVAEMVKLLENTFRMINIGLANEIALMCDLMAINVWKSSTRLDLPPILRQMVKTHVSANGEKVSHGIVS